MAYRTLAVAAISLVILAGCGGESGTSVPPPYIGSGGAGGSGGGTGGSGATGGSGGMTGTGASGGMSGTGASGGTVGSGGSGGTGGSPGSCVTNALCHTCPSEVFALVPELLCNIGGSCTYPGYVCVPSGCTTQGGAPIGQCQPWRGGSCTDDSGCPNGSYSCTTIAAGGKRCVRVSGACDPMTESYDCLPGFSCEGGTCVDRRVPCDSTVDCPKSHVCHVNIPTGSFCAPVHRTCHVDTDCAGFASRCAHVDNDSRKECTGLLEGVPCVNSACGGSEPPVCENGTFGTGTTAVCGDYGLCDNNSDCAGGFVCIGLGPDGRKECVSDQPPECDEDNPCLENQVCAPAHAGGPPVCNAGAWN